MTFKQWFAQGLRSWAESLDPAQTADMGPIVAVARPLCLAQNAIEGRSGEAKRHQVYAALIDQFPDVPRRVLSRAIEDALVR